MATKIVLKTTLLGPGIGERHEDGETITLVDDELAKQLIERNQAELFQDYIANPLRPGETRIKIKHHLVHAEFGNLEARAVVSLRSDAAQSLVSLGMAERVYPPGTILL